MLLLSPGRGKDLLWSVPVWCLGMLRRVQPYRRVRAVCHLHTAQDHPERPHHEPQEVPRKLTDSCHLL